MAESAQLRRDIFNEVAELYDEVRPGYAETVIDDIASFAGLQRAARILEVGCGTGQITIPFARRGYHIFALEPGSAMCEIARRKCRSFPNVVISQVSFEDWSVEYGSFDLFLAAQAFHWIEPVYGCAKVAELLRPGGVVALVWHEDMSQNTPFYKETQAIYDEYLPAERTTLAPPVYEEALGRSGTFTEIHYVVHDWEKTHSKSDYVKLLNTFSDHRLLPEPFRTHFFAAIEHTIDRNGGSVTRKTQTQGLLARRA